MRNARRAVWIAAALAALAGCSHARKAESPQAHPTPPGRVTATPLATQRPAPAPSKSAQAATPNPSPSATSAATPPTAPPLTVKKVPRLPPDAKPRILDVAVSETDVRPGDRVFGEVVTTSNVASVEARIGGYAVTLDKVGVGRFQLLYTVGPLPWFVHGSFTMQVIARNTRGDSTTKAIPLTVR
ncbi:MAG TPA: hypothetical protein VHT92_01595 [Candidatus Cybelea sp.]|jgi:hypothetical protein|nr:hypothetical protein [Candidatus Cybelea sp.]